MDISYIFIFAALIMGAVSILCLREEYGIATVLLLGCYFVPLQKLVTSNPYYLSDSLLEFVLYSSLILVILRKNITGDKLRIVRTPINLPIFVFLCSILFTGIISLLFFSQSKGLVLIGLMGMSPYVMFFPVIYGIRNDKQLNIIVVFIFAIAIVSAIFSIISSFYPDSIFAFANIVEEWGFGYYYYRTIPYGIHIIVFAFLISLSLLPFLGSILNKLLLLLAIFILFFAIILTFTRSIWMPLVITMVGLVALLPRKIMWSYSRWLITIAAMVAIASILLNNYSQSFYHGELITTVRDGFLSSFKALEFSGGLTADPSLNARMLETQQGMDLIKNNLVAGVGYKYRLDTTEATVSYLHNGYVSIMMVQGLVGFIPFMWLIITFFFRSLKIYRSVKESPYKGLVLGFTGGFWFILMSAFFGNGLQYGKVMILVLMLIMGLSEVVFRLNNESKRGMPNFAA
ncbi:MAG: O-antigen ligase family protein [Ignavibacteria bacterium]|nr:O-antigen ligase family protein [Ignavibacteria bacterium]